MIKFIKNDDIKNNLKNLNPARIAVAYVGSNWQEYICKDSIEEIILSPTLGSNPEAIEEIVNKLTWRKVHFLDNLHAKIYLGSINDLIIGSFNLSRNGICVEGLEEVGVRIKDTLIFKQVSEEYERLKSLAIEKYKTPNKKKIALRKLYITRNKAIREGLVIEGCEQRGFDSYKFTVGNKFGISWYGKETIKYNKTVILKIDPTFDEKHISNALTFAEDDIVEPNTWLLIWHANVSGLPRLNGDIKWLYVDSVIPNGAKDSIYTKLAIELEGKPHPPQPFSLDKKIKNAIYLSLKDNSIRDLRRGGLKDVWLLANVNHGTIKKFLNLVSKNLDSKLD